MIARKRHTITCYECLYECRVHDFNWIKISCPSCGKKINNPIKNHREGLGKTDYKQVSQPDLNIILAICNELKEVKTEIKQLQQATLELLIEFKKSSK